MHSYAVRCFATTDKWNHIGGGFDLHRHELFHAAGAHGGGAGRYVGQPAEDGGARGAGLATAARSA